MEDWENRGVNLGARVSVCMGGECGQLTEHGRKFRAFCECLHTVSKRGKAQLVLRNSHRKHDKEHSLLIRTTPLFSPSRRVPPDSQIIVPPRHTYLSEVP